MPLQRIAEAPGTNYLATPKPVQEAVDLSQLFREGSRQGRGRPTHARPRDSLDAASVLLVSAAPLALSDPSAVL